MSWYPPPSNTTVGLTGIIDALNTGMMGLNSVLGGSFFALSVLIPGWFIIFLSLVRFSPEAAFTVASFIIDIVAVLLLTLGWVHISIVVLFFVMTMAGLIGFYLHTRQ